MSTSLMKRSSYHSSISQCIPLYLVIYNNDKLRLSPTEMREIFTKQTYKYDTIKMHLRKWNYRLEFSFENKNYRNQAIEELKKLKGKYNVNCYYYFDRASVTYALMEEWEYRNAVNFSNTNHYQLALYGKEEVVNNGNSNQNVEKMKTEKVEKIEQVKKVETGEKMDKMEKVQKVEKESRADQLQIEKIIQQSNENIGDAMKIGEQNDVKKDKESNKSIEIQQNNGNKCEDEKVISNNDEMIEEGDKQVQKESREMEKQQGEIDITAERKMKLSKSKSISQQQEAEQNNQKLQNIIDLKKSESVQQIEDNEAKEAKEAKTPRKTKKIVKQASPIRTEEKKKRGRKPKLEKMKEQIKKDTELQQQVESNSSAIVQQVNIVGLVKEKTNIENVQEKILVANKKQENTQMEDEGKIQEFLGNKELMRKLLNLEIMLMNCI